MFRSRTIAYISGILIGLSTPLFLSNAAEISISPQLQTFQCGGSYSLQINVNTNGENVVASDIKFFLEGLSLTSVSPLPGFDNVVYVGTGISTTGVNIGKTYTYINVYQNSYINPLSGNITIARVQVSPISGYAAGYLTFYNLFSNNEDSNISVGTNHGLGGYPIKYNDVLFQTFDGTYTITCIPPTGGGGGGGAIVQDDCTIPSTLDCANEFGEDYSASAYDTTCCGINEGTGHEAPTTCDVSDSPYDQEITEAFSRGYDLNITNKCPITTARLEGPLNRIEAAKMLSMFSIQVIGLYPDTKKTTCEGYDDISYISTELKFFAKTSCQLNIMGLEEDGTTPQKSFNPSGLVDRAQFGTMLSRLIYGDKHNIYEGEQDMYQRYEKHLKALNGDNVMKKIENPWMLEERARILLMLKRIYDNNLVEKYRLVAPAHNGALVLLENVR